jgi:ABC-type branched-subunit amino acid transport system substrate-binding protein
VGDERERLGRFQAAEAAFSEHLERYPKAEGAGRVRDKLAKAKSAPREGPAVLLMAPFSGEFSEVGRSLREGSLLAFEEAQRRGADAPNVKLLDDQGNLVHGVQQFRKMLREERVDAVLGPAMSDVATGVAVELSARKSPIPLVTPTATTHGIASLGEGVFQLNVTTHALGRRIAEHAFDCLGLRDYAIVAPHNEYGFQLAVVFAGTVTRKGGAVAAVAYVDPEAADLAGPLQELRQKVAKLHFDQMKWEGKPLPDAKETRTWMSDSAFPIDGIFIPASSGDEANKLASQTVFNKIRGQMLGSSGWYDKALLLKSSTAAQGAYFSVDFQDQPKSEAYAAFTKAYQARWQRVPDRVAALSYDAARFLLEGMASAREPEDLIPALRKVRAFPGVLGDIVFGEDEGVNQNTALFRLEKKTFKEIQDCAAGKGGPTKR